MPQYRIVCHVPIALSNEKQVVIYDDGVDG